MRRKLLLLYVKKRRSSRLLTGCWSSFLPAPLAIPPRRSLVWPAALRRALTPMFSAVALSVGARSRVTACGPSGFLGTAVASLASATCLR
jgi:hypothetical protein